MGVALADGTVDPRIEGRQVKTGLADLSVLLRSLDRPVRIDPTLPLLVGLGVEAVDEGLVKQRGEPVLLAGCAERRGVAARLRESVAVVLVEGVLNSVMIGAGDAGAVAPNDM